MRHGIVLFTCDRGITPARAAKAAEDRGFDAFYVPEHTHIPVKREAAHPRTGDATLPDDRYTRTLDPWVSLATAAVATSRIRLSTAVALRRRWEQISRRQCSLFLCIRIATSRRSRNEANYQRLPTSHQRLPTNHQCVLSSAAISP